MPRIKKDEFVKPIVSERIFTEAELEKFHEELEPFRVIQELNNGEKVSYVDSERYHIYRNTMSGKNTIVIDMDIFGEPLVPTQYEKLENKFKQYKNWLMKKEYIKKVSDSELEKTAKNLGIIIEPIF